MKAETFDIYLKPYIHDDLTSNYKDTSSRACQINRINGINTTNRINNGLIDLCKLGSGLIRINMD